MNYNFSSLRIFLFVFFFFSLGLIQYAFADSVETNHSNYSEGDWVRISGKFSDFVEGQFMTIQILNPSKSEIVVVDQFIPNKDGSFLVNYIATGNKWNSEGEYHLKIHYGNIVLEKTFGFTIESNQIPESPCLDDEVLVIKVRTSNPFCLKETTAKRWEKLGVLSILDSSERKYRSSGNEKLLQESAKAESLKRKLYGQDYDTDPDFLVKSQQARFSQEFWKTKSDVLVSGNSTQNATSMMMLLPPNTKIYRGQLTFSASTDKIEIIALNGPLGEDEIGELPYWSPDGKTKYGITTFNPQKKMGTWKFTSNALAAKTTNQEPFSMSYSVSYMEIEPDLVDTQTITSTPESVKGHENHNVAFIIPPNDKTLRGHLTYSASEKVQLMVLHGPLDPSKIKFQPTWTVDGEKIYGITLIDNEESSGSFLFSGNALAIHSFNEKPFTVTFSLVLNPTE